MARRSPLALGGRPSPFPRPRDRWPARRPHGRLRRRLRRPRAGSGGRVNVGIVLGGPWFRAPARRGGAAASRSIESLRSGCRIAGRTGLAGQPSSIVSPASPRSATPSRAARAAAGCSSATRRGSWIRSPARACIARSCRPSSRPTAIDARRWPGPAVPRLAGYDRAMRARFGHEGRRQPASSRGSSARPALFEYAARRLAARDGVRETMGRVIGDLAPAPSALDPRFLAALLAP